MPLSSPQGELLSEDKVRFMLFYENVHVSGKNRLESLGTEPTFLWRVGFLSCHKYQWKGKQVVNP